MLAATIFLRCARIGGLEAHGTLWTGSAPPGQEKSLAGSKGVKIQPACLLIYVSRFLDILVQTDVAQQLTIPDSPLRSVANKSDVFRIILLTMSITSV